MAQNETAALILIKILRLRDWKPLSRTNKLDRLVDVLTEQQEDLLFSEFSFWLLEVYKRRVQYAIKHQQFPMQYAPLSIAWKVKKEKRGWHKGFWIASGMLMRNLRVWKYAGIYHIGFPEHHIHPVHNRPYASICRSLEMGAPARGLPARPLFTPIAMKLSRNIFYLFRTYLRLNKPQYIPYI